VAAVVRAGSRPLSLCSPARRRPVPRAAAAPASLVRLGTGLRNRIRAVAADHGYDRSASYWTGPGRGWLAELDLPPVSREIVTDCLAVIDGVVVALWMSSTGGSWLRPSP
jgi:hypothetical protein